MMQEHPISRDDFAQAMSPFVIEPGFGPLVVGVSGGPDSMALVRLAHDWAGARGIEIAGLTVDHNLRDESADEARQVHAWLSSFGMAHHTLRWEEGQGIRHLDRSLQSDARAARFELMTEWCKSHGAQGLMTAHHADDQIETFFDRLIRGSGVDGLAGIAPDSVRDGLRVLRPLLAFSKQSLVETCQAIGQPWIADPSNADEKFKRVRLRRLLSELEREGLDRNRVLKTVGHMQRAKQAIDAAVDLLDTDAVSRQGTETISVDIETLLEAPAEVGLRLLARLLTEITGAAYPPRFEGLERVYRSLDAADWSDRTLHGCQLQKRQGRLRLTQELGRR